MTENAQAPRNARIEALRLVAILGIAVFHTFQPWFSAATVDAWDVWVTSPGMLATLGCVNLLGSYGNHVFFLISGLFLVPRAVARSGEPGYWREQARGAARRAATILLTVALYVLGALALDAWVVPIEGISLESPLWVFSWLEFIWVYLVIVLATPLIGWVWGRLRRPVAVVWALAACVFAVNAYIAFVSPGDEVRDLLEWRKLMSAVSYLVAFLVGGALAERGLPRPGIALACCSGLTVAVEAAAALAGNTDLLVALSFKSTSALSFALAVCSVAVAAARADDRMSPRLSALLRRLASSILGFYVAQALLSPLWRSFGWDLCLAAHDHGEAALLATGVVWSLVLLAALLALDQLVRIPLLRAARIR